MYAIAIVVTTGVFVLFILISLGCCNYNNKSGKPNYTDTVPLKPPEAALLEQTWAVFKVYHPLVSSLVPQQNPVLAVPRYF